MGKRSQAHRWRSAACRRSTRSRTRHTSSRNRPLHSGRPSRAQSAATTQTQSRWNRSRPTRERQRHLGRHSLLESGHRGWWVRDWAGEDDRSRALERVDAGLSGCSHNTLSIVFSKSQQRHTETRDSLEIRVFSRTKRESIPSRWKRR